MGKKFTSVMTDAFVVLPAFEIWLVSLGCKASAKNEVLRINSLTRAEMNIPSRGPGVEFRTYNSRIQNDVLA